jgi:hypothetical protein
MTRNQNSGIAVIWLWRKREECIRQLVWVCSSFFLYNLVINKRLIKRVLSSNLISKNHHFARVRTIKWSTIQYISTVSKFLKTSTPKLSTKNAFLTIVRLQKFTLFDSKCCQISPAMARSRFSTRKVIEGSARELRFFARGCARCGAAIGRNLHKKASRLFILI